LKLIIVTRQSDESRDFDWLDDIREPANPLPLLQQWFRKQCDGDWDGDWEHSLGIKIETLDNPGWSVRIDVAGTRLEGKPFNRVDERPSEANWIICWLDGTTWSGVGDSSKLNVILLKFLEWAAEVVPMWPGLER
jgi:hypothetical protein